MNAPVTIPVTIELCAEDRARLDTIAGLLTALLTPTDLAAMSLKEAREAMGLLPSEHAQEHHTAELRTVEVETSEPLPAIPPEVEQPELAAPAQPDEPEKAVTADDIRALVQKLVAPTTGKRDKAKAIVTKYAPSVSEIPADKFGEVFAALKALEVEA